MPNISYNSRGGIIHWGREDWFAGLLPNYTNSTSGGVSDARTLLGKGFGMMAGIDPYRYPGMLSPGVQPADVGEVSVVSSAIVAGVSDGATAYLVGGTKNQILTLSGTPALTNPSPNTITAAAGHSDHTGITAEDVVVYSAMVSSTRAKRRFYSWYDGTDGDIGMETGGTYNDDYMTTVPSGFAASIVTGPIPMIVGTDDILYFGNGNNLGSFDGSVAADGVVVYNKLVLPKDFIITCLVNLPNYLVIFASTQTNANNTYRGDSVAFFWDKRSADPTFSYPIQTSYVTAAFNYGTSIGCFGTGISTSIGGNNNKLFLFDGSKFNVVKTFPNTCPIRGGVEVVGETIFFATNGVSNLGTVGIGMYGSSDPSLPKSFNYIGIGAGNSLGMLRNFGGSIFYLSSGTTTTGGLQKFQSGYELNARFVTSVVAPQFPPGYRARIKEIKVQYGQIASGGRYLDLAININKATDNYPILSSKTSVTQATLIQRIYRETNLNVSLGAYPFSTISIYGTYSTGASSTAVPPMVESIDIYYTLIKV